MRHPNNKSPRRRLSLTLMGLGAGLGLFLSIILQFLWSPPAVLPLAPLVATIVTPPPPTLHYERRELPQSTVHILQIPARSRFWVTVAVSPTVDSLETLAGPSDAIAAINGGFFDPVNQQSTSYIIQEGRIVADPTENERLMQNPDLIPYLDTILNRSEFRQYTCQSSIRYDIALHHDSIPLGCQLTMALGGGPRLLPTMALEQEGFIDEVDGAVIRDALGSRQLNARSAIGLTRDGGVIWIMAAQRSNAPTQSGLSLAAIANLMNSLGAEAAMNLDGGSSSAFYYNGETMYGKVDQAGNPVMRPVKSALLVQPK